MSGHGFTLEREEYPRDRHGNQTGIHGALLVSAINSDENRSGINFARRPIPPASNIPALGALRLAQ
jgi:hypothetical protein